MKELAQILLVGLGGFIGAIARYAIDGWVQSLWGTGFPYGTFVINISGSFILGVFATLSLTLGWNEHWRLLVAMGILGAYTTFSTFEYETLQLIVQGGRYRAAALNLVGSVLAGLLAAYLGIIAARWLLSQRVWPTP